MKIFIFHATAGYGHKRAADVIGKALLEHGTAPQHILIEDSLDFTPVLFKAIYTAYYYYTVKYLPNLWAWSYSQFDHDGFYQSAKLVRNGVNRLLSLGILHSVMTEKPDVIVSTHFLSAEVLASAKKNGKIKSHLITVVTDIYPHRFWVNEGTDTYWVMHDETRDVLIRRHVKPSQIQVKGIPVSPLFKPQRQKESLWQKFELKPDRFTILLTGGSFGIGDYEAVLRHLERFKDKIQCLIVCGQNQTLRERMDKLRFPYPALVFGFVDFMHELMDMSDIMISKSGGLSMAESLAKGIPMIITKPIPGQETHNARFLKDHHCAFYMEKPEQIGIIMDNIFKQPEILKMKREAVQKISKPNAAEDIANFILSLPEQNHA